MRWALIVTLLVAASSRAQGPLRAVPNETEQKAAVQVIAEVYKLDYEQAKFAAQKVELAKKLLREGTATKDDAVGRYVLLRIARDIAAQHGDLATAFEAIDQIDSAYQVDKLALQVAAATIAAKVSKPAKEQLECAALLDSLSDAAIAEDRYDHAKALADLTLHCAREGREAERLKQSIARVKEIEAFAKEFANVTEANVTLKTKPTDADANQAVGKFLCLVKGDWRRGIPMLALGSDQELKAAALMELEFKPDALKLADAWWKVSERLEGSARSQVQTHAGQWYQTALPDLTGLSKARVERYLAQIAELKQPQRSHSKVAGRSKTILDALAGTLWRNSNGVSFEWTKSGELLHGGKSRICRVAGADRVTIEFEDGHVDTLIFDAAFRRFEQHSTISTKRPLFTGERIR
jgi:hypothetical protein